jgi:hypothetical protein
VSPRGFLCSCVTDMSRLRSGAQEYARERGRWAETLYAVREAPPPSQEAGPGGDASRPVSRVLSPPPVRPPRGPPPAAGDGHPSGAPVARRLERPHPGSGTSSPWSAGALRPCSALLRAGFTWPAGHPAAGGLLPHHFTVAAARLRAPWLCPFCGTLLRVTPTGRYPAPCSAEPGLSSSGRAARGRPAGLRGESTPPRTPPLLALAQPPVHMFALTGGECTARLRHEVDQSGEKW